MNALKHICTLMVAAAVLLGVPVAAFADFGKVSAALSGVDAVSSATTVQDAPSGRYMVLVNRAKHPDAGVLADWVEFFSGDGAPLIMEDIDCVALAEDPAGVEMAESLQSRLPANQMDLRVEDAVLALSKADAGLYDAIVVSDEAARAYDVSTVPDAEVISR